MSRSFVIGLVSGYVLAFFVYRGKLANRLPRGRRLHSRLTMTKVERAIAILEQRANDQPTETFLRDWAYGNAGLEDERITEEQVESVIRSRRARTTA